MKKTKYITIFIILLFLFQSCITESNNKNIISGFSETNIFLFDTENNSIEQIAEGLYTILLSKTNRVIYQNRGVMIYDIKTRKNNVVFEENVWANEYSISPDESNIVFVHKDTLYEVNLNNFNKNILAKLNEDLYNSFQPTYSNDGKTFVFFTNPRWRKDYSNFDTLHVNLYNYETATLKTIDTVFIRNDDPYFAFFTDNSEKLIIGTQGYSNTSYKWQIPLTIYNNVPEPKLFDKYTIYPPNYLSVVWNSDNSNVLVWEEYKTLSTYNIINKNKVSSIDISKYNVYYDKVKNSDELVGIDIDHNTIVVININSGEATIYNPAVNEKISDICYTKNSRYIVFNINK